MQSNQNHQKNGHLFVGIDWADREHAVCMIDGENVLAEKLSHRIDQIADWVSRIRQKFPGRTILVAVEQSRGGLFHALMQFADLVLFPINPRQYASYRTAFQVSGAKSDPGDAYGLARMLQTHHADLRAWKPDDPSHRELDRLCELRRKAVDDRKTTVQKLESTLKLHFPEAKEIVGDLQHSGSLELLRRWPSLQEMQRAHPKTLGQCLKIGHRRSQATIDKMVSDIRSRRPMVTDQAVIRPNAMYVKTLAVQIKSLNEAVSEFDREIASVFERHDDASLFSGLPGAGDVMAPRLLVAMGSDRQRFSNADEVASYSGIAPVTRSSGKMHSVHRRYACNKYLRQTFHEFAEHARKWSDWSRAYYDMLRARGKRHNAAVRALAFKWIRILFRVWKDRQPYNEAMYVDQLRKKGSPIMEYLKINLQST